MTFYEALYRLLIRFDHPLHRRVNEQLRKLTSAGTAPLKVLDVGGRTSNYTIGVEAHVHVTEMPPSSEIHRRLSLGADADLMKKVIARRSNIVGYTLDDMVKTTLPHGYFDIAVAVEVIEHVEDDETFVRNLSAVLKQGGIAILTTPNGDYVRNTNPDHVRHYTKKGLHSLLCRHFHYVDVTYSVVQDENFTRGSMKWSLRHPCRTISSFYGNYRNFAMHSGRDLKERSEGTLHLYAIAARRDHGYPHTALNPTL